LSVALVGCGRPEDLFAVARACAEDSDCPPGIPCRDGRCAAPAEGDAGADRDDADESAHCGGRGPILPVGDGVCPDADGPQHRRALCLCDDLVASADARVDGPGAVGVTGEVDATGDLTAGADLLVAGRRGARVGGVLSVLGALRAAGDVSVQGDATIRGDAALAGRLQVGGALRVDGSLTLPDDDPDRLEAGGGATLGARRVGPVEVAPPCRCGDEAAASLPDDEVGEAFAGAPSVDDRLVDRTGEVSLACGRARVADWTAPGDVRLAVSGRAALYVEGDLLLDGGLELRLAPEGGTPPELDLVVAGRVTIAGDLRGGDPARPEALRLLLLGDAAVNVAGQVDLAAEVWAPGRDASLGGRLAGRGAWLLERLDVVDGIDLAGGRPCPG
jgi:hypothetical protein